MPCPRRRRLFERGDCVNLGVVQTNKNEILRRPATSLDGSKRDNKDALSALFKRWDDW